MTRVQDRPVTLTETPEFFSPQSLAEYLGVSRSSIYGVLERRELPAYRVGAQLRVRFGDVEAWLEARKQA